MKDRFLVLTVHAITSIEFGVLSKGRSIGTCLTLLLIPRSTPQCVEWLSVGLARLCNWVSAVRC